MAIFLTLIVLQVDIREKIEGLKVFYEDTVRENPEAGGVVHEAPKAGGVDIDMVPVGLEAGGIDIFQQLVIPRQPRTPRIPVQVNVQPPPPQPQVPPPPPPPQPQVPSPPPSPQPSDGDDSMASSGSKSDSKDLDYDPNGSDASDE